MNTQALVHQAAVLNREGIAALSCGYGEKAHSCFKNVLEIMGYITQASDIEDSDMTSADACRMESLTPISIPNMQSERFFVFNYALLFSPHEQLQEDGSPAASVYSQMDVTLFSAAAIFNMALTYNQRALMTSHRSNSSANLMRIAARMYDQCLQIVGSLPTSPVMSDDDNNDFEDVETNTASVFKMIVLNNRAHICYELEDFEGAQVALERVRKLSREISQTGMTSPVLVDEAFDEIALNVLVSSAPATAPCA